MNRLLLIDAYAMIYRAYYAFIKVPRITSSGQNTSAIFGFVTMLGELLASVRPSHIGVAFDPKGKTFRHEAYEQYKAQRPDTPEDIHAAVPYIKDILRAMNISVLECEGFEADDVIGTLAKKAAQQGFEVLMVTPDKDYGQLVSEHVFMYRPRHNGGYEKMGVDEVCIKYGLQSTSQVIDLLGLMGDSSDNIPGCPGVGEKTAVRLLSEYGSIDNLLKSTDSLKGALKQKITDNKEQILFSRFLATIRTDVPIEFDAEQLQTREPNNQALVPIYQSLEFRSLLKRLNVSTEVPPERKVQPDLFSQQELFATENQTELSVQPLVPLQVSATEKLPAIGKRVAIAVEASKAVVQRDLFSSAEEPVVRVYLTTDGKSVYVSDMTDEVKRMLADKEIEKIGFDLKSTYKQLRGAGIVIESPLRDIGVMHYLLQPELRHDAAYLSDIYLHCECKEDKLSEVAAAWLLYDKLNAELDERFSERLLIDTEMSLIEVLAEMEMAGVRFDTSALREASHKFSEQASELEDEIVSLAGGEFNVNSPRQVGEVLFEKLHLDANAKKTKGGQYVTSEEVLLSLRDKHPIIDKILEYRELKKLLTTYIDALPSLIDSTTGKIHTTYNQTVTATGRLSSSNPNLQNLPIRSARGKDIRRAVVPDKGHLFLSADYSQIELRLMAHFSGDEHMVAAFENSQDIHRAMAARIFGCPIEDVTDDMRRRAKTANFGIIYGISAFGLAQQLGSSRSEAKQLIDGYFASFPKVVDFIESAKQKARSLGYAETLFGRRRYLQDIGSRNPTVRNFAERNAVNAPIQGTAADIIKMAMVRIHRRLKEEGLRSKMIMQIHDELCFDVLPEEEAKVHEIVVCEMQTVVSLKVPLVAECGVGKNWLEAH